MLLSFAVENWMSYRNEATLSLISSLERQHMSTLSKVPGFRSKKALPLAAIYGGNASGKTGIFRALSCLKQMVISNPSVNDMVPVVPFAFDGESDLKPTMFDVTFIAKNTVYRLVVEATMDAINYESLEIISEKGSTEIYERNDNQWVFNQTFFIDSEHVEYAAKSTRVNQLFLGSAVAQNIVELREAYNWFDVTLELVGVESQAWSFATNAIRKEGFLEYASTVLSRLDTGIVELTTEKVSPDRLPQNAAIRKDISELGPDELLTFVGERTAGDYGFEMGTIRLENGQPIVELFSTVHMSSNGEKYSLPISMESSGTQRLMGLLPMLFDLINPDGSTGEKVYVVDELDRCLHTMLTKRLIEDFTIGCKSDTRKQLLFTTHDLLLMDQSLMRRDEMFISQRRADGCSELVGLSEYKDIRHDKDLIRSYLDGRFGGIPMLGELGTRG